MTNVGNSYELCTEINVTFDISTNSRNAKLGTVKHVYSDHAYNEMTLITKH